MKIKLRLRTVTPVWIGDIDSKSDLLQSTGIIGSLRWWTEAILRGMGKFACDPIGDADRCPKEKRVGSKKIKLYCPACLIFGATGMRRMFRLELNGGRRVFDGGSLNIRPDGRNRGWYLGSGLVGDIELNIVPVSSHFDESLILLPLALAANWGGIGAKTQIGYGVVEIENSLNKDFNKFSDSIVGIIENERLSALGIELRNGNNDDFPNLKEMFFAKVQFEVENNDWWKEVDGIRQALEPKDRRGKIDKEMQQRNNKILQAWYDLGSVPIAPAIKNWLIKNWLRFGPEITTNTKQGEKMHVSPFKEISNNKISDWLLGNSEEDTKTASKINISCAYKVNGNHWEFRIWGWIPEKEKPDRFDRNNFLNELKQTLNGNGTITIPWTKLFGSQTNNHKLKIWRKFNSSRDTVTPGESDINSFINSLLKD